MRHDHRGSWYLLTGVVIGVAFGLVYSWVVSPVKYVDAPPHALREDYKEQYRVMVAVAYLFNDDLVRAQDRLSQLNDDDIVQTLSMQAQRALAEGHPDEEVRALSLLASALSRGVMPGQSNTQLTPGATLAPVPSVGVPPGIVNSTIQVSETITATIQTPIP